MCSVIVFQTMWFEVLFKYNIYDTTLVVQLKKRSAAYHCILNSFYIITTFAVLLCKSLGQEFKWRLDTVHSYCIYML